MFGVKNGIFTSSNEIMILYFNFIQIVQSIQMSDIEQSQGYTPEVDREEQEGDKDQVYKRRIEKFNKNSIEGKWTQQQNLRYILYMDYHYKIFVSKEKRKSERIFKSLSDFLTTRTPRQCRSHFQKIMNKFKKLRKVRQYYQEELGLDKYQAQYDIICSELKEKNVKVEDTETTKCIKLVSCEVQTEPMKVLLSDLSGVQLLKLMNLLNEYHKIQSPIPFWMSNNQLPFSPPNNVT